MNTRKFTLVIYIILIIKFGSCELDLPRGSACLTRENISGVCRDYKECEVIINKLKSKEITPANVTFCKRQYLVVCCPLPALLNIHSERISERKCKEFEKITQKNNSIAGLLGQSPRVVTTSICQHNSIPLIVGGTIAHASEFPHQALLGYVEGTEIKWKCGGSIISSDFILTAAHCTEAGLTFVKVGMLNRSECNFNTATYRVKSIIVHPNFDSLRTNEDIALIQLQKNIKFNEHIYPICLPTKQDDYQKAIVTGFGNLGDGTYSERLMKVVVEKFDHNECSDLYVSRPIFKDTMLCYGDKRKSRDSCDGDSGGPLQVSNDETVKCTYTQVGIVSFGSSECGSVGFPGVYVNVYKYVDWIERTVWPGE